jgi:hypothetical protein
MRLRRESGSKDLSAVAALQRHILAFEKEQKKVLKVLQHEVVAHSQRREWRVGVNVLFVSRTVQIRIADTVAETSVMFRS